MWTRGRDPLGSHEHGASQGPCCGCGEAGGRDRDPAGLGRPSLLWRQSSRLSLVRVSSRSVTHAQELSFFPAGSGFASPLGLLSSWGPFTAFNHREQPSRPPRHLHHVYPQWRLSRQRHSLHSRISEPPKSDCRDSLGVGTGLAAATSQGKRSSLLDPALPPALSSTSQRFIWCLRYPAAYC